MVRNVLILYYSQFGNTAKLASAIHRQTGADILRLQVPEGYFPDDREAGRHCRTLRWFNI